MLLFSQMNDWMIFFYMVCIQVCCVCPGPWPFNLFFPVILSLFGWGRSFMALIIWSVKTYALGLPRPLSARVPVEAGRRLVSAVAWALMRLMQGRAYTLFWLVEIKVILLGNSGGVVNSLDFCPASLKSLGCFYFRCVLSSQWKAVTVNLQILHCQL